MASTLVYGQEHRLLPWACRQIGIASFRRDAYCIGLERDGELVAVAVFDNFTSGDCCMSIASDGSGYWLSRGFLAAVFAYPFTQLGNRRVTSLIASSNTQSLRFCEHLGFKREGLCRQAMDGEDMHVMGLLWDEAGRFLPKEP